MKGFAAGACRRAYVANICALSLSYAQSAASQTAIRVALQLLKFCLVRIVEHVRFGA